MFSKIWLLIFEELKIRFNSFREKLKLIGVSSLAEIYILFDEF